MNFNKKKINQKKTLTKNQLRDKIARIVKGNGVQGGNDPTSHTASYTA